VNEPLDTRTVVSAVCLAGLLAGHGRRGDRMDASDVSILTGLAVTCADALLARLDRDKPHLARFDQDEGGLDVMADGTCVPF
jgi:hypothetical protein